ETMPLMRADDDQVGIGLPSEFDEARIGPPLSGLDHEANLAPAEDLSHLFPHIPLQQSLYLRGVLEGVPAARDSQAFARFDGKVDVGGDHLARTELAQVLYPG